MNNSDHIDSDKATHIYDAVIAIPCLNEEKYIKDIVASVIAESADINVMIVIVDGQSKDSTYMIAKALADDHENIEVMLNPKRLQSAAINLVASKFGDAAPFLIRLDAHARYPHGFCKTLIEEQKKTGAASVVVSMNSIGENPVQIAIAAAQNSKMGNGGSLHRQVGQNGSWVDHGHHALFKTDVFKSLGGYDESFSHNEDAEYDHRVIMAGHKIWLTGETYLDYFPRKSFMSLFQQYSNFGKGRAKTIFKHKIRPKPRQMIPAFILPVLLVGLFGIIHPFFLIPFYSWSLACLCYGLFLSYEHKDWRVIMSGFAMMVMHLGWSCGFWEGVSIYSGKDKLSDSSL